MICVARQRGARESPGRGVPRSCTLAGAGSYVKMGRAATLDDGLPGVRNSLAAVLFMYAAYRISTTLHHLEGH